MRFASIAMLMLLVAGCSEPVKQQSEFTPGKPPTAVSIFPSSTVAGQAFNKQPDGGAAIGVKFKDATRAAVIVFGSKPLGTAHGTDFLSATVPAELYQTPGNVSVFIRDIGGESNKIDFIVKPAEK